MLKIKKITHCTLVFTGEKFKMLQDPGSYGTNEYMNETGFTHVLIADKHSDHFNQEGIETVLKNNPAVTLIVTPSVNDEMMAKFFKIPSTVKQFVIKEDCAFEIGEYSVKAGLAPHAPSYKDRVPTLPILWFTLGTDYFSSGDTFVMPPFEIHTMGLNVVTPFGTTEEFVDYALKVKPKRVFNIHDGYTDKNFTVGFYSLAKKFLEEAGIEYVLLNDGEEISF